MAAASGQPQDTQATKKQVTPEQRKLYTQLGVIGALSLVAAGIYLPGMLGGKSSSSAPVSNAADTSAASNTASAGAAPPAGAEGAAGAVTPGTPDGAAPAAASASAAAPAGAVLPVARFRPDPFQRVYFIPTPTPLPPPPRPTPTPVPIPPPVDIPGPQGSGGIAPLSPIGLPGTGGGASRPASQPFNLPPVSITRLDEAARRPTDAFPPRRTVGGATNSSGAVSPATDKRLSGVVIGDGVRALLEIQGPQGVVTRVVQPGDEVDGITVLNIQRYNDGTRTVTRMLIRQNGEERTVDLRASPNAAGLAPTGG